MSPPAYPRCLFLDLDQFTVLPRTRNFSASTTYPLSKEFEGKVRLLGFDLATGEDKLTGAPVLIPPKTLEVTVYWQAITEMPRSYKVFAQILDSTGKLAAQHDAIPKRGKSRPRDG